jgi:hypothetical protein
MTETKKTRLPCVLEFEADGIKFTNAQDWIAHIAVRGKKLRDKAVDNGTLLEFG